jgi:hypothetical protein
MGRFLKWAHLAFLMFMGRWDPASLIVEMVFTAPIYRGYHVTQFLPMISVIVFFAFSLSPIGFVLL